MKTKPILFSTPMVQAILDGRKTQTRRIIEGKTNHFANIEIGQDGKAIPYVRGGGAQLWAEPFIKPKYQIGDILWVRETWQHTYDLLNDHPGYVYRASDTDWETLEGWRWKPSIHMPKEAARLFLKVTNVRAERLQDISVDDCICEGIKKTWLTTIKNSCSYKNYINDGRGSLPPIESFRSLWESINGKESWNENPFVWVYEFEITEKPENFLS